MFYTIYTLERLPCYDVIGYWLTLYTFIFKKDSYLKLRYKILIHKEISLGGYLTNAWAFYREEVAS